MSDGRKKYLLRLPGPLLEELKAWAEQELRSLNAQIEFILRDSVRKRKGDHEEEGGGGNNKKGAGTSS